MLNSETWAAWLDQKWVINDANQLQGSIIRNHLDEHRSEFKEVKVIPASGSQGQAVSMLQMPPCYNTYYYNDGHFYRKVDWRKSENSEPDTVELIVGDSLSGLWSNEIFIKTLLGMDTIGGRMAPYE